jgi:hypothetical protein
MLWQHATSQKVTGSITGETMGFYDGPIASSRTIALERVRVMP